MTKSRQKGVVPSCPCGAAAVVRLGHGPNPGPLCRVHFLRRAGAEKWDSTILIEVVCRPLEAFELGMVYGRVVARHLKVDR